MTVFTSFVCILILAGAALPMSTFSVRASSHANVLRGGGWTLTVTDHQTRVGQSTDGSITHLGHTYAMQGDVIPNPDGWYHLLRFYGQAHPGTADKAVGLIGVAVLIPACPPWCPHGCIDPAKKCSNYQDGWYLLKAVSVPDGGSWTLPGAPHIHHVRLRMQQVHS